MILESGKVIRISGDNPARCYFAVQNLASSLSDIIYLMQADNEGEVMKNQGIAISAYGMFEIQHCSSFQSKKAWYVYTEQSGIDIRVVDI